MHQRHSEATANDSNSPKVHRREDYLAAIQIRPVIFILFRCISTEFFFSCCDSAAAPRAAAWAPRSIPCDAQRAPPRATAWATRSSTCDAQRAAPRATAWTTRRSTCDAQRAASQATAWGCQVPARRRGQRFGHHDQVPAAQNEWRCGQRPGHQGQVPAAHNERRNGRCTTSGAAGTASADTGD
jgi:hypothetical protein